MNIPGHIGYQNAIESFFFFDLELKLLMQYFKEMSESSLYGQFHPKVLYDLVIQIRKCEELLKSKMIYALRKNKPLASTVWVEFLTKINVQIAAYSETVLKLLKAIGSS